VGTLLNIATGCIIVYSHWVGIGNSNWLRDKGFRVPIPVEAAFPVPILQVLRSIQPTVLQWVLCVLTVGKSVGACPFNITVNFSVNRSHLTPFRTSQNGLLTSLPVATVSYHNCTFEPVTCHVIFQRYCQYCILATSLFRELFCDIKQ
jgi:hypothetical protein